MVDDVVVVTQVDSVSVCVTVFVFVVVFVLVFVFVTSIVLMAVYEQAPVSAVLVVVFQSELLPVGGEWGTEREYLLGLLLLLMVLEPYVPVR